MALEIERPDERTLRIHEPRVSSAAYGLIWLAVIVLFCWIMPVLAADPEPGTGTLEAVTDLAGEHPWMWIFLFIPFLTVAAMIEQVLNGSFGEEFVFDGADRQVYRNDEPIGHFDAFKVVRVIETRDFEWGDEFRLLLVRHDGGKLVIEKQAGRMGEVYEAANAMADVLGIGIEWEETSGALIDVGFVKGPRLIRPPPHAGDARQEHDTR